MKPNGSALLALAVCLTLTAAAGAQPLSQAQGRAGGRGGQKREQPDKPPPRDPAKPRPATPPAKNDPPSKDPPAPSEVTLSVARELFKTADQNGDQRLTLGEAGTTGLVARDCNAVDADASHELDEGEFLVAFVALGERQKRPIAADLRAEASKASAAAITNRAAHPTPPAAPKLGEQPKESTPGPDGSSPRARPAPGGKTAPRPPSPATPAVTGTLGPVDEHGRPLDPAAELERKVAEALKRAGVGNGGAKAVPGQSVTETPPSPVEPAAQPAPRAPEVATEVEDAPREAISAERARALREELELQLAERNASPEEAARLRTRLEERIAGPKPKERPAPGTRPGGGTRSADEREANLRAQLEAQLAQSNASPEQAANARQRNEERIRKMREDLAAKEAAGTAAAPPAPKSAETPKGSAARSDAASPDAAKPTPGRPVASPPAPEKPVGTSGEPAPEPIPAESPAEARARNLRAALETQLKESNTSPAEAEAARARLEKRLADAAAKEKGNSGGKRKKPGDGR